MWKKIIRRNTRRLASAHKSRFAPVLQALEERLAPVVGAYTIPPQTFAYDGVVQLNMSPSGGCTGSLLSTGRHVLTAAHCLTDSLGNINKTSVQVTFQMWPGFGKVKSESITVPQSNFRIYPDWNGSTAAGNDIAILLLPELAASGPGSMGADRYEIYRASDEVGNTFTVVGYGATGTGATGQDGSFGKKRIGQNRIDALSAGTGGPSNDTAWTYDFDDLNGGVDQLCSDYSICDAGLGDLEANAANGDSGGPSFVNGGIAGLTSYSTIANDSFSAIAYHTRVSSLAWWVDSYTTANYHFVVDMKNQTPGDDGREDTIELRRTGPQFNETVELWINGRLCHSDLASKMNSITIRGSTDRELIYVAGDLTVNATVEGGGNTDKLVVKNAAATTPISVTSTQVLIGFPDFDINYSGVESLEAQAGMEDAVTVYSTAAGVPLTVNGAGTVDVGHGNGSNILGTVNIINPSNLTALTVDDSLASTWKSVVLTKGSVSGLTGAAVNFTETELSSLTLTAGRFSDDFFIWSTPKNGLNTLVTTVNAGQGDDLVGVGLGGKLDGIQGRLTLNAGTGLDELHFYDEETVNSQTYTVAASQTTRTGIASITHFGFGDYFLNGGQGGNKITVLSTQASRGTRIDSGDGWDTVTIMRNLIGTTLTLTADGGADTINVGKNNLNGIEGTLDLNGGDHFDTLNVNDLTGTTGKTYAVLSNSLFVGTLGILHQDMSSVILNAGSKDDLIKVLSNAAETKLTVNGLGGKDEFNFGFENLNGILGTVDVNGGTEADTLNVNDFTGNTLYRQFIVDGNKLTVDDQGQGPVFLTSNLSDIQNLTINGGMNQDYFWVYACSSAMAITLNGGGEQDGFFVGGDLLAGVSGIIKLDGQAGGAWAQVIDTHGSAGRTYTWNGSTLSWDGIGTVQFANLVYLVAYGAPGDDVFHIQGTGSTWLMAIGLSGVDTLIGPDVPNTWKAVPDIGFDLLNLNVYYRNMENLVGGADTDTFVFSADFDPAVTIDGKGGRNTFDYSAWIGDAYVNLRTRTATGVTGSISGIQDVIAGPGNDIIVGGNIPGGSLLTGGGGRDLLIAGSTASTLVGGDGDDILIGGTTSYDTNKAQLQAISGYWAGPDSYDTRVTNLTAGNGVPALNSTTVNSNGGGNTLSGGADRDVFFGNFLSDISDWNEGTESKFSV